MATVKPDLPAGVGDHPDLCFKVPDIVGVVLVPGGEGEGEEIETRPGAWCRPQHIRGQRTIISYFGKI